MTGRFAIVRNCNFDSRDDEQGKAVLAAVKFVETSHRLTSSGGQTLETALDDLEDTLGELADRMMTEDEKRQCDEAEAAVAAALAACPEYVAGLHSGEAVDDEEVAADLARCDWTGLWPIIDGDCCLTGEVVDSSSDGYLSCDWGGMIDADVARAAGWRIDLEEGTAAPSEPVTVEFATADETIRDRGGIDEFAGLEHPAMPEACAAYRRAAIIALEDDDRANRLDVEAPKNGRILHSQWCGAHWGCSSGAIGTMAGDLTTDERAAIDAAHEAGLEAAREVFADRDAAALTSWTATHRITTDAGEVIDVMLDDGAAYSAADWIAADSPDYGCDNDGRWLFQGQPFAGSVKRINEAT